MSASLLIQGGLVIDPANHAGPQRRDVLAHEGVIVESLPAGASPQVIDASGMAVLPAGVDMHAHIASTPVNIARQLQSGATFEGRPVVPSTVETGRLYSAMGYTTVIDAAVSPSDARCAHLQLEDTPNLDAGILLLVDSHPHLLELIERDERAAACDFVAALIARTGALGIKTVNPSGTAAWRHDARRHALAGLDETVAHHRQVTPRRVLQTLAGIAQELALPHPLHLHANHLGRPGSARWLMDSLSSLEGRRAHVAHLQFHAYGQARDGAFLSAATELCAFLHDHPHITADVGMVAFGQAMTITADTPFEHALWRRIGSPGRPASFGECELEAGFGVMPMRYDQGNLVHSLQWAIGLELLLTMENPWQVCLSIDHPNGGSFLNYPHLIALLMDHSLRQQAIAQAHPAIRTHTTLADIRREMTLEEIAILTRSGPARMLGIDTIKGQLGHGADADITLHPIETPFARPALVIRQGRVIARDGQCQVEQAGRPMAADVHPTMLGLAQLEAWLRQHGSMHPRQFGLSESQRGRLRRLSRKNENP